MTEHRGDANRLGVAVQIGTVRLLGAFLDDPADAPPCVVRFAAEQIGLDATGTEATGTLDGYAQGTARWRHHVPRIRQRYGHRTFTEPSVSFRLDRFLYALCWTGTDRPSGSFDRAVAWLQASKVLLPGLSVLERTVARVRSRANARLFSRLVDRVTPEQRAHLDALVTVPERTPRSPLDRLRNDPTF